jgi:hypothetical protein
MSEPTRTIHCCDALDWLKNYQPQAGTVLVGSLPDFSEFPQYSLKEWQDWFTETAALILEKTNPEQAAYFFQSDIKHEGQWIDKAYLCQKAAEKVGSQLLWHKIFCRLPAGQPSLGRPGYSHLLCFSKSTLLNDPHPGADVVPSLGQKTWARGMGFEACCRIVQSAKESFHAHTLINPFCGHGSVLAVANAYGLHAIGIERSAKRAKKAQEMAVHLESGTWLENAQSALAVELDESF